MNNADLYAENNDFSRIRNTEILKEYNHKIRWNGSDRVIDVGCGDGALTSMLQKFMPETFVKLVGTDINENMINFAKEHHTDKRISFLMLDIGGEVPTALRSGFDHVFSFNVLHWVYDQEHALRNVYELLAIQGDCLLVVLTNHPAHEIFRVLSKRPKWLPWTKHIKNLLAPYQDLQESECLKMFRNVMTQVGFSAITVEIKNTSFVYKEVETYRKAMRAIIPYNIPAERQEEFMDEYMEVAAELNLIQMVDNIDRKGSSVVYDYSVLVAFGRKLN